MGIQFLGDFSRSAGIHLVLIINMISYSERTFTRLALYSSRALPLDK
jgi:hypothetical protein